TSLAHGIDAVCRLTRRATHGTALKVNFPQVFRQLPHCFDKGLQQLSAYFHEGSQQHSSHFRRGFIELRTHGS
ncbi:MAG: hypothetical protein ACI37P_07425, partial [Eggerthellaceae bacterium]